MGDKFNECFEARKALFTEQQKYIPNLVDEAVRWAIHSDIRGLTEEETAEFLVISTQFARMRKAGKSFKELKRFYDQVPGKFKSIIYFP